MNEAKFLERFPCAERSVSALIDAIEDALESRGALTRRDSKYGAAEERCRKAIGTMQSDSEPEPTVDGS